MLSSCSSVKARTSPAFSISQDQKSVPILPFTGTLVPESFSEAVFNDFVDNLNDSKGASGFEWFGIIKEDLKDVEKVLTPAHVYLSGEIWSYIENSGCCSTELRVKSRLRIFRVLSRELLWEAEIPLDSFFEHDTSNLTVEREKLAKRLSAAMSDAAITALKNARHITAD
jgi:hypothetical protein